MNWFHHTLLSRFSRALFATLAAAALLLAATPASALDPDVAKKREIVDLIVGYHVSGIEKDEIDLQSIDTIIASLHDPYTQYFSQEQWEQFIDLLENNYSGIGIRVGQDDNGFYVNEVFAGTPAAEAGIQSGDYLVEVEGESTQGRTTEELVAAISGPEGTDVRIAVERDGRRIEFALTRKEIHIPALTSRLIDQEIGYVKLISFTSDADELFSKEIDRLQEQGMKSLVLDLRDNPGGLLDTAGNMASRFMEKGNLIHTRDRQQNETPYPVKGNNPIDVPVIVLVNEFSASASEVLAGALQDYEIATLIGRQTFGKGSVQSMFSLKDGSVLKLTVQEYLTPLKHPVNKIGLKPDLEVYGDAAQLITALQQAGDIDIQLTLNKKGLSLNGQEFADSFKVYREDGMTYVPSRILASMVSGEISWDAVNRSVVIRSDNQVHAFDVNSEGVKLDNGVSYIALNRFQTQYQSLAWTDQGGVLTIQENGKDRR